MTQCIRCGRALRRPTPTGMGPVCAKAAPPLLHHERDLFGYDTEKAAAAALQRLQTVVRIETEKAHGWVSYTFDTVRAGWGIRA